MAIFSLSRSLRAGGAAGGAGLLPGPGGPSGPGRLLCPSGRRRGLRACEEGSAPAEHQPSAPGGGAAPRAAPVLENARAALRDAAPGALPSAPLLFREAERV